MECADEISNLPSLDLYDDLLTDDSIKQQHSKEELHQKYNEAEGRIKDLEKQLKLSKTNEEYYRHLAESVQQNLSNLFVTAKAEIQRKDTTIKSLRDCLEKQKLKCSWGETLHKPHKCVPLDEDLNPRLNEHRKDHDEYDDDEAIESQSSYVEDRPFAFVSFSQREGKKDAGKRKRKLHIQEDEERIKKKKTKHDIPKKANSFIKSPNAVTHHSDKSMDGFGSARKLVERSKRQLRRRTSDEFCKIETNRQIKDSRKTETADLYTNGGGLSNKPSPFKSETRNRSPSRSKYRKERNDNYTSKYKGPSSRSSECLSPRRINTRSGSRDLDSPARHKRSSRSPSDRYSKERKIKDSDRKRLSPSKERSKSKKFKSPERPQRKTDSADGLNRIFNSPKQTIARGKEQSLSSGKNQDLNENKVVVSTSYVNESTEGTSCTDLHKTNREDEMQRKRDKKETVKLQTSIGENDLRQKLLSKRNRGASQDSPEKLSNINADMTNKVERAVISPIIFSTDIDDQKAFHAEVKEVDNQSSSDYKTVIVGNVCQGDRKSKHGNDKADRNPAEMSSVRSVIDIDQLNDDEQHQLNKDSFSPFKNIVLEPDRNEFKNGADIAGNVLRSKELQCEIEIGSKSCEKKCSVDIQGKSYHTQDNDRKIKLEDKKPDLIDTNSVEIRLHVSEYELMEFDQALKSPQKDSEACGKKRLKNKRREEDKNEFIWSSRQASSKFTESSQKQSEKTKKENFIRRKNSEFSKSSSLLDTNCSKLNKEIRSLWGNKTTHTEPTKVLTDTVLVSANGTKMVMKSDCSPTIKQTAVLKQQKKLKADLNADLEFLKQIKHKHKLETSFRKANSKTTVSPVVSISETENTQTECLNRITCHEVASQSSVNTNSSLPSVDHSKSLSEMKETFQEIVKENTSKNTCTKLQSSSSTNLVVSSCTAEKSDVSVKIDPRNASQSTERKTFSNFEKHEAAKIDINLSNDLSKGLVVHQPKQTLVQCENKNQTSLVSTALVNEKIMKNLNKTRQDTGKQIDLEMQKDIVNREAYTGSKTDISENQSVQASETYNTQSTRKLQIECDDNFKCDLDGQVLISPIISGTKEIIKVKMCTKKNENKDKILCGNPNQCSDSQERRPSIVVSDQGIESDNYPLSEDESVKDTSSATSRRGSTELNFDNVQALLFEMSHPEPKCMICSDEENIEGSFKVPSNYMPMFAPPGYDVNRMSRLSSPYSVSTCSSPGRLVINESTASSTAEENSQETDDSEDEKHSVEKGKSTRINTSISESDKHASKKRDLRKSFVEAKDNHEVIENIPSDIPNCIEKQTSDNNQEGDSSKNYNKESMASSSILGLFEISDMKNLTESTKHMESANHTKTHRDHTNYGKSSLYQEKLKLADNKTSSESEVNSCEKGNNECHKLMIREGNVLTVALEENVLNSENMDIITEKCNHSSKEMDSEQQISSDDSSKLTCKGKVIKAFKSDSEDDMNLKESTSVSKFKLISIDSIRNSIKTKIQQKIGRSDNMTLDDKADIKVNKCQSVDHIAMDMETSDTESETDKEIQRLSHSSLFQSSHKVFEHGNVNLMELAELSQSKSGSEPFLSFSTEKSSTSHNNDICTSFNDFGKLSGGENKNVAYGSCEVTSETESITEFYDEESRLNIEDITSLREKDGFKIRRQSYESSEVTIEEIKEGSSYRARISSVTSDDSSEGSNKKECKRSKTLESSEDTEEGEVKSTESDLDTTVESRLKGKSTKTDSNRSVERSRKVERGNRQNNQKEERKCEKVKSKQCGERENGNKRHRHLSSKDRFSSEDEKFQNYDRMKDNRLRKRYNSSSDRSTPTSQKEKHNSDQESYNVHEHYTSRQDLRSKIKQSRGIVQASGSPEHKGNAFRSRDERSSPHVGGRHSAHSSSEREYRNSEQSFKVVSKTDFNKSVKSSVHSNDSRLSDKGTRSSSLSETSHNLGSCQSTRYKRGQDSDKVNKHVDKSQKNSPYAKHQSRSSKYTNSSSSKRR